MLRLPPLYAVVILPTMVLHAHGREPIRIAEGSGEEAPKQPQLSIDADGTVHLVYGVKNSVLYSRSRNSGETFTPATMAFDVPNLSLGMRRGPRIANAGKILVVTAIGGKLGKGKDGDLMAWRSEDQGHSWSGPVRVNDVSASAREGLHAMTAAADGTVWCVWLDLRAHRTELFASKSVDGGATWSENVLAYRSPSGSICECCHPSIAIHDSVIHVMFRNSLSGNRDMYIVSSTDNGKTFTEGTQLGVQHWELFACPMDGGMLTVDQAGKVSTVWRRGGELFYTADGREEEIPLGPGEQPWIANSSRGPIAIWTVGRMGELRVRELAQAKSRSVVAVARDPVIASSLSGQGPIMACWESQQDGASLVVAVRIDAD